uniref:hypothetical protein n=1 Tax=Roseivirga sp. TaxID=1964215 RepID=UPI0040475CC2
MGRFQVKGLVYIFKVIGRFMVMGMVFNPEVQKRNFILVLVGCEPKENQQQVAQTTKVIFKN